jgi:hypothetical protein
VDELFRAARAREGALGLRRGIRRWFHGMAAAGRCGLGVLSTARARNHLRDGGGRHVAARRGRALPGRTTFAATAATATFANRAEAERLDPPVGTQAVEMGCTGHQRHHRR